MFGFDVIYKGRTYHVHDMNDRCYIARNSDGMQVWLLKKDCEVV